MTRVPFGIRGTGSYVPEGVLTNDHLSKVVDTSDAPEEAYPGVRIHTADTRIAEPAAAARLARFLLGST